MNLSFSIICNQITSSDSARTFFSHMNSFSIQMRRKRNYYIFKMHNHNYSIFFHTRYIFKFVTNTFYFNSSDSITRYRRQQHSS